MEKKRVIKYFGSHAEVAKACQCSIQAVGQWGKNVPEMRQYQIEVITGGEIKSDFTLSKLNQGAK